MCIHRKRPRPPGEEALYKYPTHRVGYHPASGLWWRGNPHKRCANRDQTTAVPRQTAHGTLWDPYPVPARGRVAVAAIAERAQVTHTQRARRRQRQPPCADVQPPRAPRLWDPRHPAPSLPVLTNVRDLRAACRPQAPRDVLLDGTRGGRLSGLKIVGLVVGILVEASIAEVCRAHAPWDSLGPHPVARGRAAVATLAERAHVARTHRARHRQRQLPRRCTRLAEGPLSCGRGLSTLTARLARFSFALRYLETEIVDGRRDGRRGGRRVAGDGVGGIFPLKSCLCMCRV